MHNLRQAILIVTVCLGVICVAAIATGIDDGSIERDIIKSTSDFFIDVSKMTTSEAFSAVRSLDIDVLVDYDGSKLLLTRLTAITVHFNTIISSLLQ